MGNETSKARYSKMEGSQPARVQSSSSLFENNEEKKNEKIDNPSSQKNIEELTNIKPKTCLNNTTAEEEKSTTTTTTRIVTTITASDEIEEIDDESDSKLEKLKKGMISKMNAPSSYAMIPAHE